MTLLIDFSSDAANYRRKSGGGKAEAIARAVGVRPGFRPYVVDATAGLGRDSFVLAGLGCQVQMIERAPAIASALQRAMENAAGHPELSPIIARMQLHHGDAIEWLEAASSPRPDVIMVDPMFPERTKSALVKKEMRLFKEIVGEDNDAPRLLSAALAQAIYRVVVKRPRLAPALTGIAPSFSLKGNSTRFDIYTLKGVPK